MRNPFIFLPALILIAFANVEDAQAQSTILSGNQKSANTGAANTSGAPNPLNPCRTEVRKLHEVEGFNTSNQILTAFYFKQFGKFDQSGNSDERYVILSEFGDQQTDTVDVYNGWLKVFDRQTGKLTVFPMTGPSNREPMGAYRLPKVQGDDLLAKSESLKNQALKGLSVCKEKTNNICLSQQDYDALYKMIGQERPLVIAMPGSHDTAAKPGSKKRMATFDPKNQNADGINMVAKKWKAFEKQNYQHHLCDGLLANIGKTSPVAPAATSPALQGAGIQ